MFAQQRLYFIRILCSEFDVSIVTTDDTYHVKRICHILPKWKSVTEIELVHFSWTVNPIFLTNFDSTISFSRSPYGHKTFSRKWGRNHRELALTNNANKELSALCVYVRRHFMRASVLNGRRTICYTCGNNITYCIFRFKMCRHVNVIFPNHLKTFFCAPRLLV